MSQHKKYASTTKYDTIYITIYYLFPQFDEKNVDKPISVRMIERQTDFLYCDKISNQFHRDNELWYSFLEVVWTRSYNTGEFAISEDSIILVELHISHVIPYYWFRERHICWICKVTHVLIVIRNADYLFQHNNIKCTIN